MHQQNRQQSGNLASEAEFATYTNRMGDTYYLHEGKTKTGKIRYFAAKKPREGALSTMPKGFEFSESINGVVSVRRVNESETRIPDSDIALVQTEMDCHHHLYAHRMDVVKGEILVFEPANPLSERCEEMGSAFPMLAHRGLGINRRVRYNPVMKFVPLRKGRGYSVHRMTYRGDGGWSWPLACGPLHELARKFLCHVGTDEFFELM